MLRKALGLRMGLEKVIIVRESLKGDGAVVAAVHCESRPEMKVTNRDAVRSLTPAVSARRRYISRGVLVSMGRNTWCVRAKIKSGW